MASKQFACKASEVPADAAKIIKLGNLSLGIFRVGDGYHALLNVCPHKGAALCQGPICGTTKQTDKAEFVYERAGELVRCAWHGWEFDIRTGEFLVDPRVKARTFPVSVESEDIFVHV
ncbi:Rieske (2Fe-2S) protein [Sinorhizobium meliloti]|uniref:Rieske (2Fe-2S) protein n=1 Tax=Rhizobium meliloti TaxID=382 RepID=UPI000FD841E3|nr:Rieske (2Fe-2S) protein [Sinorhizobium meliloti]RVL66406.1 Rieske (2Fe-2S) protein [Sinorhizobium meliloti]